jgi:hypothetical protein
MTPPVPVLLYHSERDSFAVTPALFDRHAEAASW